MARCNAICDFVKDGYTFRTNGRVWIRLARVHTPKLETTEGQKAKMILVSLILKKPIAYEQVAVDTYGRTLAEVWVNLANVNDYMRAQGYV
jgi:endonuclease YncB( thermonuclease family)